MSGTQTIVVIDDDDQIRALVEMALAEPGRRIEGFGDGEEALRFLSRHGRVDLILSDILMEGFDGHRLLRHLRSNAVTASTPVIFIGDDDTGGILVGGMHDFGVEHVRSPLDISEVRVRVEAALSRAPHQPDVRDAATGLLTRAGFEDRLHAAYRDAVERRSPIAVALVALDDAPSEEVLRRVAIIVAGQLRESDAAARFSESAVVTFHRTCDANGAAGVASRILAAVDVDTRCAGAPIAIGIAVATDPATGDARGLIAAADQALRDAKLRTGARVSAREL
jgi:PleD family two-component response regulator